MRRLRLIGLAALALFAFAAVTAASASAEEANNPAILLLSGEVKDLTGKFTGGASKLIALPGGAANTLSGTSVTALLKGCENLGGSALDTNLCKDSLIEFKGVKTGAVACRSENLAGTKDAIETVLAMIDLHIAAEETLPGKVLQPLLITKALGVDLDTNVILNCGGLKIKVLGSIGCLLLPGLVNIAAEDKKVKIVCELTEATGDPITGDCVTTAQLCKELKEDPLGTDFGAGEKDAWFLISLEGSFNKDVFIDD